MSTNRPRYRSIVHDSVRWNDFPFRSGDIVISTPPKCGTTWLQMICALMIFQDPNLDRPLSGISPWLDMLLHGKAEVFAAFAAQQHRRFIKTHTPLDGLPMEDQVTYICVGRDPRDVAISMINHMANMDYEVFQAAIQKVVRQDGIEDAIVPDTQPPPETLEAHFWHWVDDPTPITESISSLHCTLHHFEEAFRARDQANVVVMHYGDLKADTEGEMRRLAERLDIEVPEKDWPQLVKAASFDSMRARATDLAPNSTQNIWKDPQQFFHSGTGGRWREFFDDTAQRRYEARVAALTSTEVATWAHFGWRDVHANKHRIC